MPVLTPYDMFLDASNIGNEQKILWEVSIKKSHYLFTFIADLHYI